MEIMVQRWCEATALPLLKLWRCLQCDEVKILMYSWQMKSTCSSLACCSGMDATAVQVEQYTLSTLKRHLLLCDALYHTLDIQCCLVCVMLSVFLPWLVSMNAFGRLVRSGMCFTASQICLLVIVIANVSHFQCPCNQLSSVCKHDIRAWCI